ncbi:MAG: DeoR/GlpR transcriptional regulator [Burkholderiaceae bacterium]|nr:MAG: DeoR/GlpR transcriptional regulator [Burkholderiaceae bacterium]
MRHGGASGAARAGGACRGRARCRAACCRARRGRSGICRAGRRGAATRSAACSGVRRARRPGAGARGLNGQPHAPSLSARQQRILDWLRAGGSLSIQTLAHRLQVSGETVRRDVQGLVDAALVQRFHGGVRLHRSLQESPFEQRLRTQVAAKRQLAQAVAALVPDGASLALDNNSTACFVAQALAARRRLTVFTPSLEVARALVSAQAGHTVLMPGGVLRATDMTLTGAAALRYAAQLRPDCFVLSVAG